ncbi:MAG TPA: SHOCT domain-containing protein [Candidatus Dormibacteraeota bacterium]|nr:SHOCT domain-containing protein [Candidatus Dormibacteraeota bacterium]
MAFVGHLLALLIQLVFWGGLIVLVIWAVRRFSASRNSDNALSILNERFARGEIDQQEYDTRKATLTRR